MERAEPAVPPPALLPQLKHTKVGLVKMVIGEDAYTDTWDVSVALSTLIWATAEYDLVASVMKTQHYVNLKQTKKKH